MIFLIRPEDIPSVIQAEINQQCYYPRDEVAVIGSYYAMYEFEYNLFINIIVKHEQSLYSYLTIPSIWNSYSFQPLRSLHIQKKYGKHMEESILIKLNEWFSINDPTPFG